MTTEQRLEAVLSKFKSRTPEEEAALQQQRQREQQEESEHRFQEIFKSAGCPPRHTKATTLDRGGSWGAQESAIKAKLGSGFLIALIGTRGGGKTQLAVEAIRHNARDFKRSRFCTAIEFFMEVKASYRDEGETEKDVLDRFCKPALLVIDEVGKRSDTEWENRLLYELINRRYNDMKDTLLISNQDAGELQAALGPSIVSRMRETGGVIECNWESYRK